MQFLGKTNMLTILRKNIVVAMELTKQPTATCFSFKGMAQNCKSPMLYKLSCL